jgi:cytochrome c
MISWCIEKPNEGVALATDSEAMKALEAYSTWSNKGNPAQPSRAPGAAAPAEAVHSCRSPELSTTVTVPAEEDRCPTGC